MVDHLSNYGFVGKLNHRNGEELGDKLGHNLSGSLIPGVLQSDNGREVSGLSKLFCFFGISYYLFGIL